MQKHKVQMLVLIYDIVVYSMLNFTSMWLVRLLSQTGIESIFVDLLLLTFILFFGGLALRSKHKIPVKHLPRKSTMVVIGLMLLCVASGIS